MLTIAKLRLADLETQECKQWSEKFGQGSSPVAYKHTVGFLRKIFEEGISAGAIYLNPASAITWRREKPKAEKLPEPDQFHKLVESVRTAGGGFSSRCGEWSRRPGFHKPLLSSAEPFPALEATVAELKALVLQTNVE